MYKNCFVGKQTKYLNVLVFRKSLQCNFPHPTIMSNSLSAVLNNTESIQLNIVNNNLKHTDSFNKQCILILFSLQLRVQ